MDWEYMGVEQKKLYNLDLQRDTKELYQEQFLALIAEKERLERELQQARDMLENALRIGRERANASRNLNPKKVHDGYVVIGMQQWSQNYIDETAEPGYEDRSYKWLEENARLVKEKKTVGVWKTVLQTPYDCLLPFSLVLQQTMGDLKEKRVLEDLGLTDWDEEVDDSGFGQIKDCAENLAYKKQYRANFKNRLWEIEIYSLYPVQLSEKRCLS